MALRMDAENTYQVFDWLWTSGQLSARDIEQLPALGIEAVVNLALPTSTNALPARQSSLPGKALSGRSPSSRSRERMVVDRPASKISGKAIANLIAPIHLNFCWRIRPYASVS
jgi:hypothetical protein